LKCNLFIYNKLSYAFSNSGHYKIFVNDKSGLKTV